MVYITNVYLSIIPLLVLEHIVQKRRCSTKLQERKAIQESYRDFIYAFNQYILSKYTTKKQLKALIQIK